MDLWSPAGAQPSGKPDLLPTRALLRHRSCARVLDLIRQVRVFYPELDGITIRVGLTRSAAGLAARQEPWVWMNPRKLTRHTVAHELTHLLQFRGLIPSGEKSADLYSLARHPFLADDLPYYLKTPRGLRQAAPRSPEQVGTLLHRIARESVLRRERGERTYLRWFEDELAWRWRSACETGAPAPTVPEQASLF